MKCLYHANCIDGAAAALAVWQVYGDENNEFIPVQHGLPLPQGLEEEDIILVDFSYPRQTVLELVRKAKSITIIDHHKTAQQELEEPFPSVMDGEKRCDLTVIFDMEKSGAVLTWEYFNAPESLPILFKYIQDRDLWRWEYPQSKDVTTGLELHPDWRQWLELDHRELAMQGGVINAFLHQQGEKLIELGPRHFALTGDTVPLYNLPGFMLSDTLDRALEKYPDAPYAVGYLDSATQRRYSLRSRQGEDVDVSLIAKRFGGGGHKHAAGFSVDL